MIRLLFIPTVLLVIMQVFLGCQAERDPIVVETQVDPQEVAKRPVEPATREEKALAYALRYLELKEESPEAAMAELRKAYDLFAQGDDTLWEEYFETMKRLLHPDGFTLLDALRAEEIELKLARKNNEPHDYIKGLEQSVEELRNMSNHMQAMGIDVTTAIFGHFDRAKHNHGDENEDEDK